MTQTADTGTSEVAQMNGFTVGDRVKIVRGILANSAGSYAIVTDFDRGATNLPYLVNPEQGNAQWVYEVEHADHPVGTQVEIVETSVTNNSEYIGRIGKIDQLAKNYETRGGFRYVVGVGGTYIWAAVVKPVEGNEKEENLIGKTVRIIEAYDPDLRNATGVLTKYEDDGSPIVQLKERAGTWSAGESVRVIRVESVEDFEGVSFEDLGYRNQFEPGDQVKDSQGRYFVVSSVGGDNLITRNTRGETAMLRKDDQITKVERVGVGTRVKIVGALMTSLMDDTGEVVAHNGEGDAISYLPYQVRLDRGGLYNVYAVERLGEEKEETATESETTDPRDAEIQSLEAQLKGARESRDKAVNDHIAAMQTIGDRLIEEANNRSWCSEYDEIVEDLNRQLVYELPLRHKDYEVYLDVTLRVRVDVSEQRDADSAADYAKEMMEDQTIDIRGAYDVDVNEIRTYNVEES